MRTNFYNMKTFLNLSCQYVLKYLVSLILIFSWIIILVHVFVFHNENNCFIMSFGEFPWKLGTEGYVILHFEVYSREIRDVNFNTNIVVI